jgi:hypothetical protein
MPPVGFEPSILAGEPPKTYALDRAATGTDISKYVHKFFEVQPPPSPNLNPLICICGYTQNP